MKLKSAGIYPSRRRDQYLVSAVDQGLSVDIFGHESSSELFERLANWRPQCVAIAAASALGSGLLRRPEVRARHGFGRTGTSWSNWRVGEAALRRRGVELRRTPEQAEALPGWLSRSIRLSESLQNLGYERRTESDAPHLIEVNPQASFAAMLKRNPLRRNSMEGRMQRQLVLYLEGLDIRNPLDFLEEITRFHLLEGNIALKGLHSAEELDCLCAAYVAHLVTEQPSRVMNVGDSDDGQIFLPVPSLLDRYP